MILNFDITNNVLYMFFSKHGNPLDSTSIFTYMAANYPDRPRQIPWMNRWRDFWLRNLDVDVCNLCLNDFSLLIGNADTDHVGPIVGYQMTNDQLAVWDVMSFSNAKKYYLMLVRAYTGWDNSIIGTRIKSHRPHCLNYFAVFGATNVFTTAEINDA